MELTDERFTDEFLAQCTNRDDYFGDAGERDVNNFV
jgi:hypothetical protein